MRRLLTLSLVSALLAAYNYPVTERSDVTTTYFGVSVADPYRWLEQTKSEQTEKWVAAQTEITRAVINNLSDRESFDAIIKGLKATPRDGVPSVTPLSTVWSRVEPNQQAGIVMVRQGKSVRTLLNPNTRWPNGLTTIVDWKLSPDGKTLAYATERAGSGMVHWAFIDVSSGRDIAGTIVGVPDWAVSSWAMDSKGYYYDGYGSDDPRPNGTPVGQGFKAMFHVLGTAQSDDVVVYERPDRPTWLPYASESLDGKYLVAGASGGAENGNLVAVRPLRDPRAALTVIRKKTDDSYSYIDSVGSTFYFLTSHGAPNGKLIAIDVSHPDGERDVIPEQAMTLNSVAVSGEHFVAQYLKDASSRLYVYDRQGRRVRRIALPGIGTASFFGDRDRDIGYYSFSNITTRLLVIRYNVRTGASRVFERVSQPFDPSQYTTEELFADSTAGARIPVFVAYRKGTILNGTNRTLITGYGGFGAAYTPFWETLGAAWIAHGGIFAVACVRGGGEYGESWHQAGMLANKQHAFDDFAAASRLLIGKRFSSAATLAAYGYSGGGLLVGITEVQHPDLFGAVAEGAGPVDVLRGETYGGEAAWVSEVGSPTASAEQFKYLYAYAPLPHIRQGTHYPATLIMTSENDAVVSPAHSYKFAATLQWAHAGNAPVLLYVAKNSGHTGNSLLSEANKLTDAEAFLWSSLGEKEASFSR